MTRSQANPKLPNVGRFKHPNDDLTLQKTDFCDSWRISKCLLLLDWCILLLLGVFQCNPSQEAPWRVGIPFMQLSFFHYSVEQYQHVSRICCLLAKRSLNTQERNMISTISGSLKMLESFLLPPMLCWPGLSNFCFLHAFIRDDPYGHVARMLHDILQTDNKANKTMKNKCHMPSPTRAESLSWMARYWILQGTFCANPSVFQPHDSTIMGQIYMVGVRANALTMYETCIDYIWHMIW